MKRNYEMTALCDSQNLLYRISTSRTGVASYGAHVTHRLPTVQVTSEMHKLRLHVVATPVKITPLASCPPRTKCWRRHCTRENLSQILTCISQEFPPHVAELLNHGDSALTFDLRTREHANSRRAAACGTMQYHVS